MKKNPWNGIDLDVYEKHMQRKDVFQLQTLNQIMREQFCVADAHTVMILGVAGGNGLEHIRPSAFQKVYGVDVNGGYLSECCARYPRLQGVFQPLCVDLTESGAPLPHADLLVADLLIEYIGYENFANTVAKVAPKSISCVIQIDTDGGYVSDSPYRHSFDCLDEVHVQVEEEKLVGVMRRTGYLFSARKEYPLPNGKKLVKTDFLSEKFYAAET